jgi:uncharacterized membrane protein
MYNIHPIFVHFPIALLLIYSIIIILPLHHWLPKTNWKDIGNVLLILGFLGGAVSAATGETGEEIMGESKLIEMHALFASLTLWIFGLLIAEVVLDIINKKIPLGSIKKYIGFIIGVLGNPVVKIILAIVGLIVLTITGMLGGAIVYGTTADPFTAPLLRVLGL